MSCLRLTRATVLSVAIAAVALAALLAPALGQARTAPRTVVYRGLSLHVPAGWPVISLAARPATCVRFDRHAVYLGSPGPAQACPPAAIGRTEAILVSPARRTPGRAAADAPAQSASWRRGRVTITATWNRHPALVARALGLRGLPVPAAAGTPRVTLRADLRRRSRLLAHAASSGYAGLAFDTCSTPSAARLAAWDTSPYRGIGVYIGGINSACAQPNLTPAWVSQAAREGWHLILTYVGRQAPRNVCGCASISPSHAAAEGVAAADDAIGRAAALGIGPGAPIYFDMESYPTTASNRDAVLAFLAAWTTELHRQGDRSGVYSSTSSGVADLVAAYGTGYAEPDEMWFADWNAQPTVLSGAIPASDWAAHQRVHQYLGDHRARYGGVTLDIDSDYVDGATAGATGGSGVSGGSVSATATSPVTPAPSGTRRGRPARPTAPVPAPTTSPLQDGQLIEIAGTGAVYRIAGGAPMFVRYWDDIGGVQPVTAVSAAQFEALRAVPADGTIVRTGDGAVYVIAGGYPFALGEVPAGQTATLVDIWDIENLNSPLSHLAPVPADGTVVVGQASGTPWIFEGGQLDPAPSRAGATPVSDPSLSVWPLAAAPATGGSPVASSAPPAPPASASPSWPSGDWAWPN